MTPPDFESGRHNVFKSEICKDNGGVGMTENKFFPEIHGNFGFGCMRLPMAGDKVDYKEFEKMADAFIEAGLNYFDTAHGYIGGQSETAIRDCVAKRYDRSRFLLTNKLTDPYFNSQEDIRPVTRGRFSVTKNVVQYAWKT